MIALPDNLSWRECTSTGILAPHARSLAKTLDKVGDVEYGAGVLIVSRLMRRALHKRACSLVINITHTS